MEKNDKISTLKVDIEKIFKNGFFIDRRGESSCNGTQVNDISLTKKEGYTKYVFPEINEYTGQENNFSNCISHFLRWINPSENTTIEHVIESYIQFSDAQIQADVHFNTYHAIKYMPKNKGW